MIILCSRLVKCEEGDTIICYQHAHKSATYWPFGRMNTTVFTEGDIKGMDHTLSSHTFGLLDLLLTELMNTRCDAHSCLRKQHLGMSFLMTLSAHVINRYGYANTRLVDEFGWLKEVANQLVSFTLWAFQVHYFFIVASTYSIFYTSAVVQCTVCRHWYLWTIFDILFSFIF